MNEEKLFDIEYWLPFSGGEYHCTIAVEVTQSYVDKVKEKYEESLAAWRVAPSAWSLPYHHTMKVIPHEFMDSNKSFIKVDNHNMLIEKEKDKAKREGIKEMAKYALTYITNSKVLDDFKKNFKQYL